MKYLDVVRELNQLRDSVRAESSKRYFKTHDGGYAYGDKFLGITVPAQRVVAKKFRDLLLGEVEKLLKSDVHEHRFVALEILVFKYERSNEAERKKLVNFYLKYKKFVNNWDLVDTSAPYILGNWLLNNDRSVLYKLASSKSLWDRRIAVVSTWTLIRHGEFADTLRLAEMMLKDQEDLMHKACGWMLREVGKKSPKALLGFLKAHYKQMPRTMLRYSIERLEPAQRAKFMKR